MRYRNPYVRIARPDHWFKNIFVLPGVLIAALYTNTPFSVFGVKFIIGLVSVCLIASVNYVINEWLDAEFDRFHPVKKNRPSVLGSVRKQWVYVEYLTLLVLGLISAWYVSEKFLLTTLFFVIMGLLYNVKPFRTKDRIYADVLTESINNVIRLVLGWFIVTSYLIPPTSLMAGYWMAGAFLMSAKRLAEYRFIGDSAQAALYRRSFKFYTEERLLVTTFFYGICSAFFLGVFLMKYRIELLLSFPFIALLFTWYLHIGLQKNSSAQEPEYLFCETKFVIYGIFLVVLIGVLFFIRVPSLGWLLNNSFLIQR